MMTALLLQLHRLSKERGQLFLRQQLVRIPLFIYAPFLKQ